MDRARLSRVGDPAVTTRERWLLALFWGLCLIALAYMASVTA